MLSDRDMAINSLGWLEGFSAWVWSHVLPDNPRSLDDEFAEAYDQHVSTLRKAVLGDDQ